jgi:hypothetical protein
VRSAARRRWNASRSATSGGGVAWEEAGVSRRRERRERAKEENGEWEWEGVPWYSVAGIAVAGGGGAERARVLVWKKGWWMVAMRGSGYCTRLLTISLAEAALGKSWLSLKKMLLYSSIWFRKNVSSSSLPFPL